MKFFLLFDSMPLTPAIPLKALTSQGMRLDVACRMLRACVLGPDGRPTGHSVSTWFAGKGNEQPALAIHIDGRKLDTKMIDLFRSELVLARHLKVLVAGIARGTGLEVGEIHIEGLDGSTSAQDAFLDSIRRWKHDAGKKIILLHEHGMPVFDASKLGTLTWKQTLDDDAAIVVGNHQGFPAQVEEELLSISDLVVSLGIDPPCNAGGAVSYLGSHVITFVRMFHATV